MTKQSSKQSPSKRPQPKSALRRPGRKAAVEQMNQASTDEFEREDMGIAPKE